MKGTNAHKINICINTLTYLLKSSYSTDTYIYNLNHNWIDRTNLLPLRRRDTIVNKQSIITTMYQYTIIARILYSIGFGSLILSLAFGWVSFSVPDWLQFYENDNSLTTSTLDINTTRLVKFGLWKICSISNSKKDFECTLWSNNVLSFVGNARALIPLGLALSTLSFLLASFALMCRQGFVTNMIFSALLSFLSFIFITIGTAVFASESLAHVERVALPVSQNPRRWGFWLLIPNIILSLAASLCFIIASILNWIDYRNMLVTGILSHSGDKYNDSVCKALSDSNTTTIGKPQYPYQDYPTTCFQLNGTNNNNNNSNNQQNTIGYPPPPSYGSALVNPGYQPTPPGLFGYSNSASSTAYPHQNFDPYYPRNYMSDTFESDEISRTGRSRRHSRSCSRSRHHSDHRSRSNSASESSAADGNNQKSTQFIPIPVPYYQSQPAASAKAHMPMVAQNQNQTTMPYTFPMANQQYLDDANQPASKVANAVQFGTVQPTILVSNPTQPIYTIAYRANNPGNILASNVLTGPAAATYVTATREQMAEITSYHSDSDNEDDQTVSVKQNSKKVDIKEAWVWRKM